MLHRAVRDKAAGGGAAALSAAEVAQVLRQYEAARGPHVARVQAAAEGAFRSCVGESRLGRTLRDWVLWWVGPTAAWLHPACEHGVVAWLLSTALYGCPLAAGCCPAPCSGLWWQAHG